MTIAHAITHDNDPQNIRNSVDFIDRRSPCRVGVAVGIPPTARPEAERSGEQSPHRNLHLRLSGGKKALLRDDDGDRRIECFFRELECLLHRPRQSGL